VVTSTAHLPCAPQDVVVKRKPGGQPGNRNRFKTGRYSKRTRALRHEVGDLKRAVRETLLLADAALKAGAVGQRAAGGPRLVDTEGFWLQPGQNAA
jgi:hypothetical protein